MKPSLFAVMLLIFNPAGADDHAPSRPFDPTPYTRFTVSQSAYHRDPIITLKTLIASEQKNDRINRFCLVGYERTDDPSDGYVWVHWLEEQTLMLWDGSLSADWRAAGLTTARRSLRLGRDTVKTEYDIGGSTYLITEQTWHKRANDCATFGEKYTIHPFKAPPRPRSNDAD